MNGSDRERVRAALRDLPGEVAWGAAPDIRDVYVPRSHLRAVDPNVPLATGMRGAGKTFWWGALQKPGVRRLIARSEAHSALSETTVVATGFGNRPAPDIYPGIDVLPELMKRYDPRTVWRAVAVRQLAGADHPVRRAASWPERVAWIDGNPEAADRLLHERDSQFGGENRYFLILFDALDRSADNWQDMYRSVRGLLRLALDMRSYRRLRIKIFLRPDQIDEARVADFPDASKILASSIELEWPRRELYGLLWHILGNGGQGGFFRDFFGGRWEPVGPNGEDAYRTPRNLVNEERQRGKFHDISGPWMGTGPRRGFPYTWIPNHLGDGGGLVSPRSFLAALREAAVDTRERYPGHGYALHYESIKQGVMAASKIRVRENREDYPWVQGVMESLEGMTVPVKFESIANRWRESNALETLADEIENEEVKLPPAHMDRGPEGVRSDLEALGVFQCLRDGRVNIPDVYRLGYRLGRKGGVKRVR